jgi:hypothetical protein
MVRVEQIELALTRMVAASSRKVKEDVTVSTLEAIDRLQKLSIRFHAQWLYPSPWLVLEDCWTVPASMPVPKMLEDIAKHGAPIGIVGMAHLKHSNRDAVLKINFRKDAASQKTVEVSAEGAANLLEHGRSEVFSAQVFLDPSGETMSMYYSFHPPEEPEPGSRLLGRLVYSRDGRIRTHLAQKNFREAMEQARKRFEVTVQKFKEIKAAEPIKV